MSDHPTSCDSVSFTINNALVPRIHEVYYGYGDDTIIIISKIPDHISSVARRRELTPEELSLIERLKNGAAAPAAGNGNIPRYVTSISLDKFKSWIRTVIKNRHNIGNDEDRMESIAKLAFLRNLIGDTNEIWWNDDGKYS